MFNNIIELVNEIEKGKTNEEIITERLKYLNSSEYRNKQAITIKRMGSDTICFHEGFISYDMIVSFSTMMHNAEYVIDEINIYSAILDIIRKEIDFIKRTGTFKLGQLFSLVRDYYRFDEEKISSEYYDAIEYLKKQNPKNIYHVRDNLPLFITLYRKANFAGDLLTFIKIMNYGNRMLKSSKKIYTNDEKKTLEKYKELCDAIDDNEQHRGTTISIKELKALGIAQCTEYSMLLQNCLSFLGYDTFMIAGKVNNEPHNYNVVSSRGKFVVLDVAQNAAGEMLGITTSDQLLNFGSIEIVKQNGQKLIYTSEYEHKGHVKK